MKKLPAIRNVLGIPFIGGKIEKNEVNPARKIDEITPLNPLNDTLEHLIIHKSPDAYTQLVQSLEAFYENEAELSDAETTIHNEIIADDAHNLAASILAEDEVVALGLRAQHPDNIGFEQPPTLPHVFVLMRAYDRTGDKDIANALAYIFDSHAPVASELLAEAFERGVTNSTPVMKEYRQLAVLVDSVLDTRRLVVPPSYAEDGTSAYPFIQEYLSSQGLEFSQS